MDEGYLIIDGHSENVLEVNLLIHSIKKIDSKRKVSVATNDIDLKFVEADKIIRIEEPNPTVAFFKSLLASPYNKTIAVLPDQILTSFDTNIWENLRGMGCIVLPKNRFSFNDEIIDPTLYPLNQEEIKSFSLSSIPNAVYFNREKECDDIFGLAVILSSNYEQHNYIDFFADKEHNMPPFPNFIWPTWMLSFLQTVTDDKIKTFDFMHCVDLSKQENNYINNNWTKRWSEFLTYWVNEDGVLKIENFVQRGLIKYESSAWLTQEVQQNLKK